MIQRRSALIFIVLLAASLTGGNVGSGYFGAPGSTRITDDDALGITQNLRHSVALPLPLASPRILVKKAERKLFLYSGSTLVRTYRIGLGLSPVGDKVRQGDRRTPEGDFYIFTKNDQSAFYLSLGISYPNAAHAQRGLRDGLVTKSQYDTIMQALEAHKTPPQNTKLGGDIYIHGNGAGSDWTWGCVALENEDIRELFNAVAVGTPVTIKP
ncbi:MAG TPA: L,D-transpeptidase family protein [Pyrinomonadaceae bacterium]|jgi:murein L,D-transpeptidase YafK|nr:L,D-transpeptidase family protein [Pyrinomonadaceae bacterium]